MNIRHPLGSSASQTGVGSHGIPGSPFSIQPGAPPAEGLSERPKRPGWMPPYAVGPELGSKAIVCRSPNRKRRGRTWSTNEAGAKFDERDERIYVYT